MKNNQTPKNIIFFYSNKKYLKNKFNIIFQQEILSEMLPEVTGFRGQNHFVQDVSTSCLDFNYIQSIIWTMMGAFYLTVFFIKNKIYLSIIFYKIKITST